MNIHPVNFSSSEIISVQSDSWYGAGKEFGFQTAALDHQRYEDVLQEKDIERRKVLFQATRFYETLQRLCALELFTVQGVRWGDRYLELLNGYAAGTGLSLMQCVQLQLLDQVGCQTVFIHDRQQSRCFFVHTEENAGDPELLHLSAGNDGTYRYRFVNMNIGADSYSFFAYPGMCFGGPAMGINHRTNSFVASDTLYTRMVVAPTDSIWGNALAGILFAIGDVSMIRDVIRKVQRQKVAFLGSYAFHIAQQASDQIRLTSVEFGYNFLQEHLPHVYGSRRYIAQANYPRSKKLQLVDTLRPPTYPQKWASFELAQTSYQMRRRIKRLAFWAKQLQGETSQSDLISMLMYFLRQTVGDEYKESAGTSTTGFLTPYLAAHAVGIVTPSWQEVHIGKLHPHSAIVPLRDYWDIDGHVPARDLAKIVDRDFQKRTASWI